VDPVSGFARNGTTLAFRRMRRGAGERTRLGVPVALLALVVIAASASADGMRAVSDETQVARGRYLAHDVAMCVQCHTPRDERGDLDLTRLFAGAPIPVGSPFPHRPWAFQAQALAGLPGWTDADAITLLMTGRRPSGVSPSPPMPSFRFTHDDAAAVVGYLRSLGAAR
jgi:mono/diheme cytochrome c family protein